MSQGALFERGLYFFKLSLWGGGGHYSRGGTIRASTVLHLSHCCWQLLLLLLQLHRYSHHTGAFLYLFICKLESLAKLYYFIPPWFLWRNVCKLIQIPCRPLEIVAVLGEKQVQAHIQVPLMQSFYTLCSLYTHVHDCTWHVAYYDIDCICLSCTTCVITLHVL